MIVNRITQRVTLACWVAVGCDRVSADNATTNRNDYGAQYMPMEFRLYDNRLDPVHMDKHWLQYMATYSSVNIYDRFGPFSIWNHLRDEKSSDYWDRMAHDGRSAVRNTISDALRETAVFYFRPLIDHWKLVGESIGETILNVVGNTREQRATEAAFGNQFSIAHEIWLDEIEDTRTIYRGIRPRLDPYAYVGLRIGRNPYYYDEPCATIELRARYIPPDTERLEAALRVNITPTIHLEADFRIVPLQVIRGDNDKTAFVLSLGYNRGRRFSPYFIGIRGFLYGGTTDTGRGIIQQSEGQIMAIATFPWN